MRDSIKEFIAEKAERMREDVEARSIHPDSMALGLRPMPRALCPVAHGL